MSHLLDRLTFFNQAKQPFSEGHGSRLTRTATGRTAIVSVGNTTRWSVRRMA